MSIDPVILLRYRLAVARVGERDIFHWWESNALTEEGQYALGRLFRQTPKWAGVELALEAARIRHEALVPLGASITLFNLGPEIEDSYSAWIRSAKTENRLDVLKVPVLAEASRTTVVEAFRALDLAVEEIKPKEIGDRAIHVTQIDPDDLRTDALRVIRLALGAYLMCSKGRFLAPYMTLKLSRS